MSAFDWTPYIMGGATRPDGITGLDPRFQTALQQFLLAADEGIGPGLQIYSGYRSPELQGQLWREAVAKYGSEEAARKWVAPPGRSMHNKGMAADLKYNGVRLDQVDPAIRDWVLSNAGNYGLAAPMSWEPWQVEYAGARGGDLGFSGIAPTAAADAAVAGSYSPPAAPEPQGLMAALANMSESGALESMADGLMPRMTQMMQRPMTQPYQAAARSNPLADFFAKMRA